MIFPNRWKYSFSFVMLLNSLGSFFSSIVSLLRCHPLPGMCWELFAKAGVVVTTGFSFTGGITILSAAVVMFGWACFPGTCKEIFRFSLDIVLISCIHLIALYFLTYKGKRLAWVFVSCSCLSF